MNSSLLDWDKLEKGIADHISGADVKREDLEFFRRARRLVVFLEDYTKTTSGMLTAVTGRILELEKELSL